MLNRKFPSNKEWNYRQSNGFSSIRFFSSIEKVESALTFLCLLTWLIYFPSVWLSRFRRQRDDDYWSCMNLNVQRKFSNFSANAFKVPRQRNEQKIKNWCTYYVHGIWNNQLYEKKERRRKKKVWSDQWSSILMLLLLAFSVSSQRENIKNTHNVLTYSVSATV